MARNRSLRERKERKLYSDDWALGDEEIEGFHTFDLDHKITTEAFKGGFVKDMTHTDFDLSYFQKHGFNWPLLFKQKEKLGIVVPGPEFTINDVRQAVGSRRMLDVMDVNTQKNVEMTMKDWQKYFESKDKDKLLNVISLEFSHTRLEHIVQAPTVVRQIDWVEKVWPRHLKEAQTEATNVLDDMMYPKVQKYCLMSVGGCYTDFHIDFGGTSVWYHIVKGRKLFWLIPPTEANIQLYEQWVLSGKQSDVFFGDTVEKCERIELEAGYTFFIPTGWIHAVYTPIDSLVFGGNFLHSYGIEKQLRVAQVEDTTHVPQKFRYPFFTEMLWYVLERYVHVLLGRTHLGLPPTEHDKLLLAVKSENKLGSENNNSTHEGTPATPTRHLTRYELHGLKAIVMYLHSLPNSKKNVPDLIRDPVPLIQDVKALVELHRFDRPELAMTSKPVLEWWQRDPVRFGVKRLSSDGTTGIPSGPKRTKGEGHAVRVAPPNHTKIRYRRVRCRECERCNREDCRACSFCLDMTKYGGSGILKQRCKFKKCAKPILPAPAVCYLCDLNGYMSVPGTQKNVLQTTPSTLMECSVCFKVSHPKCTSETDGEGLIHSDLPNSWDCPECVSKGYNKEYKSVRAANRSTAASSDGMDVQTLDKLKTEVKAEAPPTTTSPPSSPPLPPSSCSSIPPGGVKTHPENGTPIAPPMPTWDELQARVTKTLVTPQWVIRPTPIEISRADAGLDDVTQSGFQRKGPEMCGLVLLGIFKYLGVKDILNVMRVCREWARWSIHPSLWPHITIPPNKEITPTMLEGIVRRQPMKLTLNFVKISQDQLLWLLTRLPQLRDAEFEGLSWGEIRVITTCFSPPLKKLNLNFCEGINNDSIDALLSVPASRRPGFRNVQTSRMINLTHLSLANAFIGDTTVKQLCNELQLVHLDLSHCMLVTVNTIAIIAEKLGETLESLDCRSCKRLKPLCLPELTRFKMLGRLGLMYCPLIPAGAVKVWGKTHGYTLDEEGLLTRVPPSIKQFNLAMQSQLIKSTFQDILKAHMKNMSTEVAFDKLKPAAFARKNEKDDEEETDVVDSKPSVSDKAITSEEVKPKTPEKDSGRKKRLNETTKGNIVKKRKSESPVPMKEEVKTSPRVSRRHLQRLSSPPSSSTHKPSKRKMKQVSIKLEDISRTTDLSSRTVNTSTTKKRPSGDLEKRGRSPLKSPPKKSRSKSLEKVKSSEFSSPSKKVDKSKEDVGSSKKGKDIITRSKHRRASSLGSPSKDMGVKSSKIVSKSKDPSSSSKESKIKRTIRPSKPVQKRGRSSSSESVAQKDDDQLYSSKLRKKSLEEYRDEDVRNPRRSSRGTDEEMKEPPKVIDEETSKGSDVDSPKNKNSPSMRDFRKSPKKSKSLEEKLPKSDESKMKHKHKKFSSDHKVPSTKKQSSKSDDSDDTDAVPKKLIKRSSSDKLVSKSKDFYEEKEKLKKEESDPVWQSTSGIPKKLLAKMSVKIPKEGKDKNVDDKRSARRSSTEEKDKKSSSRRNSKDNSSKDSKKDRKESKSDKFLASPVILSDVKVSKSETSSDKKSSAPQKETSSSDKKTEVKESKNVSSTGKSDSKTPKPSGETDKNVALSSSVTKELKDQTDIPAEEKIIVHKKFRMHKRESFLLSEKKDEKSSELKTPAIASSVTGEGTSSSGVSKESSKKSSTSSVKGDAKEKTSSIPKAFPSIAKDSSKKQSSSPSSSKDSSYKGSSSNLSRDSSQSKSSSQSTVTPPSSNKVPVPSSKVSAPSSKISTSSSVDGGPTSKKTTDPVSSDDSSKKSHEESLSRDSAKNPISAQTESSSTPTSIGQKEPKSEPNSSVKKKVDVPKDETK